MSKSSYLESGLPLRDFELLETFDATHFFQEFEQDFGACGNYSQAL
jgi:hypothetical protein